MKCKAYAKINLFLEVNGKRPDGYHNITSVMQEIDLCDELDIVSNKSGKITLEVSGNSNVPTNEHNLVYKAAELLKKKYKISHGVHIVLKKHIPIGAGLGGGSSDAAVVLKALNNLWKLKISHSELIRLGASIGADIPFFFYGGRCVVKGIGEKVTPIGNKKKFWIVLVFPSLHISTKEVYSRCMKTPKLSENTISKHKKLKLNAQGKSRAGQTVNYRSFALTKNTKRCSIFAFSKLLEVGVPPRQTLFFNRLEEAAFSLAPKLIELKSKLDEYPVVVTQMSGSGSAVFAIAASKRLAQQIKDEFAAESKNAVWVVRAK